MESYKVYIYVLLLEGGYYYIGRTYRPEERLSEHLRGKGSAWTKKHAFVKLLQREEFIVSSKEDEDRVENMVTLEFMRKEGWNKVRGGYWVNVNDIDVLKNLHHHGYFINIDIDEAVFESVTLFAYVLSLKQKKYYLGTAKSLEMAMKNHKKGKLSEWTKKYPPIDFLYTQELFFEDGRPDLEILDDLFLKFGKEFGFKNIRGGRFRFLDEKVHLQKIKEAFPNLKINVPKR